MTPTRWEFVGSNVPDCKEGFAEGDYASLCSDSVELEHLSRDDTLRCRVKKREDQEKYRCLGIKVVEAPTKKFSAIHGIEIWEAI